MLKNIYYSILFNIKYFFSYLVDIVENIKGDGELIPLGTVLDIDPVVIIIQNNNFILLDSLDKIEKDSYLKNIDKHKYIKIYMDLEKYLYKYKNKFIFNKTHVVHNLRPETNVEEGALLDVIKEKQTLCICMFWNPKGTARRKRLALTKGYIEVLISRAKKIKK